MLPPKLPGHIPPNASSPAGATATRPSIGLSGSSMRLLADSGRSRMPVMRCAIDPPDESPFRQRLVEDACARVAGDRADPRAPQMGNRDVAIRRQLQDAHDERVARRRALDVEGPDLSRPGTRLLRVVVVARLRERLCVDDVAGLDAKHGLAHGKRRHTLCRHEFPGLAPSPARPRSA